MTSEREKEILNYSKTGWGNLELNKEYKIIAIEPDFDGEHFIFDMICEDEEKIKKKYMVTGNALYEKFLDIIENKKLLKHYNVIEKGMSQIFYPKYKSYIMIINTPDKLEETSENRYIEPIIKKNSVYLLNRCVKKCKNQSNKANYVIKIEKDEYEKVNCKILLDTDKFKNVKELQITLPVF